MSLTTHIIMHHLATHFTCLDALDLFSTHLFKEHTAYMWSVLEFKAQDKQTWRQHAQLLLSTVIAPLSPSIVWEIPRVQRVRYILLINAGTSLQQIHKLNECNLAFSSFPGILNRKVVLTPRSKSTGLKNTWQACYFSQCSLKIFFIFRKMLHLV